MKLTQQEILNMAIQLTTEDVDPFIPTLQEDCKAFIGLHTDAKYEFKVHYSQVVAKAKVNHIIDLIKEIEARTK